MTEANAGQGKAADNRKAEKALNKQRAAEELRKKRRQQLEIVRQALVKLEEQVKAIRGDVVRYETLKSHLTGFYEEIDKLAKGKALIEATHLGVEQTNDIIRDSKTLIKGDTYLDRVKEFVPAGENPVYPDVLLKLRTIQQSLIRFGQDIESQQKHATKKIQEVKTIQEALECYMEENPWPSKADLRERLAPGTPTGEWFRYGNGTEHFDFDKFDRLNLADFFSARTSNDEHEQ